MTIKNFLMATGILLACGAVRADIKYTTEMTLEGAPAGTPKTTTMRAVKPSFERTETTQKIGPMETKSISIRKCGKNQTIQLAPDLKIYAVAPDDNSKSAAAARTGSTPRAGKEATSKMVLTYAVKDLGAATVLNFPTRRYMVETETQSSGCAGQGTSKIKQEFWISDLRDANPCPDENSSATMEKAMSHSECKIEVELKGDSDKFGKIMKGLVLRQKMYNGDAPFMTMEVTSLSQAKLGNELFIVPADFKEVSLEEFQKAQAAAMLKAMHAGIRIEPSDED